MSYQYNSGMPYDQSNSMPYPNQSNPPYPPYPPYQNPNHPNHSMPQPGYPPQMPSPYPVYPMQSAPQPSFGTGYTPEQPYTLSQYSNAYAMPTHHEHSYQQIPLADPSYSNTIPNYPSQVHNEEATEQIDNATAAADGEEEHGTPTVWAVEDFDSESDAKELKQALKKSDNDVLIEIICRRSNEQRQIIRDEYKKFYGKDLIKDICSETSGHFAKLLVALMTPYDEFYANELRDAMAGSGTNEEVLIEILCSSFGDEINDMKVAYEKIYKKDLESALKSETSGHFKRLMVALCNGCRADDDLDEDAAERDARELIEAGVDKMGTDESTFNMVFCARSFDQIKLISDKYQEIANHTLEYAIKKEISGRFRDGLLAILKCSENKPEFFATLLHKSMDGIGTNDKQLIRLIVTRSEVDLGDIKETFIHLYGKDLRSWIKKETSGDYKHTLYALIGEERS